MFQMIRKLALSPHLSFSNIRTFEGWPKFVSQNNELKWNMKIVSLYFHLVRCERDLMQAYVLYIVQFQFGPAKGAQTPIATPTHPSNIPYIYREFILH